LGDAKLLAASGAWVSWTGLPSVVLIAALAGLVFAVIRARRGGGIEAAARVPFGTFLCLGTWIVWLYGPLQIGLPWLEFSASPS
jgi:leader peptidase (prepilin peptidase)/N-methyltransferase